VWAVRDFRIAVAGRGVSAVGDAVTQLALLIRVHDQGGGAAGVAAVLAMSAAAVVLLAPWAGTLVDSRDSRRLAVGGSVVAAAAVAGMALGGPLWTVLVLVFVLEGAQAVTGPTWGALTPRIVGPARAAQAVGWVQSVASAARITGPLAGGVLIAAAGTRAAFLADAVSFAAVSAAAAAISVRRHPDAEQPGTAPAAADPADDGAAGGRPRSTRAHRRRRWAAGLAILRADRVLWTLTVALAVFIVGAEASNVLEVFLVRDALHAGTTGDGVVSAVAGCGLLAGSIAATRLSSPARRVTVLLTCLVATAVVITAGGLAPTLAVLAVLSTVGGFSNGLINATFGAVFVQRVSDSDRGRTGATLNALTRSASLAALALGALAGALFGPRTAITALGAITLLLLAVLVPRTTNQLRRAAAPPALTQPPRREQRRTPRGPGRLGPAPRDRSPRSGLRWALRPRAAWALVECGGCAGSVPGVDHLFWLAAPSTLSR